MGITKGKKIMVFIAEEANGTYKSFGYATNHTLSTSASTISVSHKDTADTDTANGHWEDNDIDTLNWSISTEGFIANDAEGYSNDDIFDLFVSGKTIYCKFGIAPTSTTGVPDGGWNPQTGEGITMKSGKGIITSYDENAPVEGNATCNFTITGKGALARG